MSIVIESVNIKWRNTLQFGAKLFSRHALCDCIQTNLSPSMLDFFRTQMYCCKTNEHLYFAENSPLLQTFQIESPSLRRCVYQVTY